ncbi:unnamed protein product [Withania somnifera]
MGPIIGRITGGLDETVRLWDPSKFTCVQTFTGHCLGVVSVATHPTRRIAASASIDSFIRVFEVDSNKTISTLEAPPSEVWQLQFSPNGSNLAAVGGGSSSVKLWDTTQWQLVVTMTIPHQGAHNHLIKAATKNLSFQLHGVLMVGFLLVVQLMGLSFTFLDGHCMPVRSLVFSPSLHDSRILFSASDDGHVHVYDAEGKTLLTSLSGHASWVLSVDVSPDGAAIATGSSDKTVRLWDLKMRAATQTLTNHTDQVWVVAFGPTSRTDVRSCMLASVSDDKSLSFYQYS